MDFSAATWQPLGAPVTPFWRRMPHFFIFAGMRAPLLRNLAVSSLLGLVALWCAGGVLTSPVKSVLGLTLAYFVGSIVIAQFGFLVIERTSAGFLRPQDYPKNFERGSAMRPYKMFLITFIVPCAIGIFGAVFRAPILTVCLALLFAALLPASTMVLTMTDSFTEAINPFRCIETVRAIGPSYLVLCIFLLLLMFGADQALQMAIRSVLPSEAAMSRIAAEGVQMTPEQMVRSATRYFALIIGAASFVGNYFFFMMCALIGYVMFQYADALGLSVVGPGETRGGAAKPGDHARRSRDVMIGQMVAAGEIGEAIEFLNDDLRDRPTDLSLHARLRKLLLIEGSAPRIADHAERYLNLLMKSGNAREALALVGQCFAAQPDYTPRNLDLVAPLARAAMQSSQGKLAAKLIRGFDKRHPGHPAIPEIYLIGAELLLESSTDLAQPRKLLGYVVKRFAQNPAALDAQRLLDRLDRLQAKPAPSANQAAPATLPVVAPPTLPDATHEALPRVRSNVPV